MGREIREEDIRHCNMVSVGASMCVCIQVLVCWQVWQEGVLNGRSLRERDKFRDRWWKHRVHRDNI